MPQRYPVRFRAFCSCGWEMLAYEVTRCVRAAEVHGELRPGHHAGVSPVVS